MLRALKQTDRFDYPSSWLTLPALSAGDNKAVFLAHAAMGINTFSINAQSNYTITITDADGANIDTINALSAETTEFTVDYSALSAKRELNADLRQFLIEIYAAGGLTALDTSQLVSAKLKAVVLDVSSITSTLILKNTGITHVHTVGAFNASASVASMLYLQPFTHVKLESLDDLTNLGAMFRGGALEHFHLQNVSSSVSNGAHTFRDNRGNFDIQVILEKLPNLSNIDYMFFSTAGRGPVDVTLSALTTASGAFRQASISALKLTAPQLANISLFIKNNETITSCELTVCANITNTASAFLNAYSLSRLILTGIVVSFDVSTTALNKSAQEALFISLGTTVAGVITLKALGADYAAAINKGWLIAEI